MSFKLQLENKPSMHARLLLAKYFTRLCSNLGKLQKNLVSQMCFTPSHVSVTMIFFSISLTTASHAENVIILHTPAALSSMQLFLRAFRDLEIIYHCIEDMKK